MEWLVAGVGQINVNDTKSCDILTAAFERGGRLTEQGYRMKLTTGKHFPTRL
jgi:hypothetical protein